MPGNLPFRLLVYQRERFPLAAYIPITAAFTFSAATYSRAARGDGGLVPWPLLAVGALTSLVFFLMLRVLDEHKDAAVDLRYRPELPVPRGLVSLRELRCVGGGLLALVLLLNALVEPRLLLACAAVAVWAALMTREFFAPEWLRARPTLYLVSHMAIMPMIDAYTTGLDWIPAGARASGGLICFLIVTFLNGTLIEIGRKIRPPEEERQGVDTYTRVWGPRAAPIVWLLVLVSAGVMIWVSALFTRVALPTAAVVAVLVPLTALPAAHFLSRPSPKPARNIEKVSGLWTLATYMLLGLMPLLWPSK